jgi:hypothetical protein
MSDMIFKVDLEDLACGGLVLRPVCGERRRAGRGF